MQIKVGTVTVAQERNFKEGDTFPVIVRLKGTQQHRIFFSEFASIIVSGDRVGEYVPHTCSVYDKQYVVAVGVSTTLAFTQD